MKRRITWIFLAGLFFGGLQPIPLQAQIGLDVGGYMQSWYIARQSNEMLTTSQGGVSIAGTETIETQGFRLRRARLMTRGSINETFSATTWVEFSGSSPSLLCFYADARLKPWFTLRIGQIMMPGQSYDTARNASSWLLFYERPAITTALSNAMGYSAFRDVGIMAYGQKGRLWYGVHAGNGAGRFNQAGSTITQRKAGGGLYGARIDWEMADGLILGGHVSTNQQRSVVQSGIGPFDINRTSYSLRAATNNLGIGGLFSQVEYMALTSKDANRGLLVNEDGEYRLHGFYAELGYRITQDWRILGRYDEMTEKPGQAVLPSTGRSFTNNYTLGFSRFIFDDNKEIARIHLNYAFGKTGPMDLENSILLLVFQLRFIP